MRTIADVLLLASVLGVACLAGCDSDDDVQGAVDSGAPAADGGAADDASTAGPRPDAGSATPDAGQDAQSPPGPPATALNYNAKFIGNNGPHYITGTITLPVGASAGRRVQIEVIRKTGTQGNVLGLAGMTGSSPTVTYTVTGLEAASYQIGVRVDQTNNGMVNDSGDYIGFARGMAGSPKLTAAAADVIVVTGPTSGVDLGLAVVP